MPERLAALLAVLLVVAGCASSAPDTVLDRTERYERVIELPPPSPTGVSSLEEALFGRRSVRDYSLAPIELSDLGRLLWAAQGITDDRGHRTAPSAGALYPLEVYAVTADSIMHYLPEGHRVEVGGAVARPADLAAEVFGQNWIATAPVVIVITGVVARTEAKYGAVAERLMDREAGHAAQNLLLAAVTLDLVSVPVGGFDPEEVGRLLALPPGEEVLYLVPVGHPA